MGLKEWIVPQDKVFFELLEKQSKNVAEAAKQLRELFNDFSTLKEKRSKMKELEHDGDKIVHELYSKLNETLITPLDHADISRLASRYDDVLDYLFATVNWSYLYDIKKPTKAMKQFADLIEQQITHVNIALLDIRELKKEEIEKQCVEIHKIENAADDLLYDEITKLFKLKNPIEVMKLKEIYEYLEIVTDKCEDVSDVLLDIRMKYG